VETATASVEAATAVAAASVEAATAVAAASVEAATTTAVETSSTTAATVTTMLGKGRDREDERERSEYCKNGLQQGGFPHRNSLHQNDG
jgi:hypothetical protein